jgi:hypothetical protein
MTLRTIQVKKIEREAAPIEKRNPSIFEDPDELSKLILDGNMSEHLIAYFTEIKNYKNRSLNDIQKFPERTTRSNKRYHVKSSGPSCIDSKIRHTEYQLVISKQNLQRLQSRSRKKALNLRKQLGLTLNTSAIDGFTKLKGLLNKYPNNEVDDSVELLREARQGY